MKNIANNIDLPLMEMMVGPTKHVDRDKKHNRTSEVYRCGAISSWGFAFTYCLLDSPFRIIVDIRTMAKPAHVR